MLMTPAALEQAYTTQAGAALVAIELKSGMIAHQSPSFKHLTSWIPVEARGNIRVSLESSDGEDFHKFCQSVVRDAGEPYGATFLDRNNVVGHRSITVRFFHRAPGPPGLANPEWLLMMRAVKLTLVGVQPRQLAGVSPAAGRRLSYGGTARISEAVGVFTADLSGGTPQQWTLHVAHARYLLDLKVASGTYDTDTRNQKPLEQIAMLYSLDLSKGEGSGASLLFRAAAQLEYAATSALNIAHRSATWLTRKALQITKRWAVQLNDDDTVTGSFIVLFRLFGGLSTSVSTGLVAGKVGFSHGGLQFLYFVADPEQPLDGNLRATWVRIASVKTGPIVVSFTWGGGKYRVVCKMLSLDSVGSKVSSVEDVSQLLEKLKISPGGGHLSDGSTSICVGQSDVHQSG
jgi:hypothetical protein